MLDGELIETRFAWPDENKALNSVHKEMDIQSKAKLGLNEVQYITGKFAPWCIFNHHIIGSFPTIVAIN